MDNFILFCLIIVPMLLILVYIIKLVLMIAISLIKYFRRKQREYNEWYEALTAEEKILEELKRANQIRWFHFFK